MRKTGLLIFTFWIGILNFAFASEPIRPLPQSFTYDKPKAMLGKKLFFDPILSKDGTVACINCHVLESGGDDGMKVSFGIHGQKGNINSPTVFNAVFNFRQFWDGRAKDLEEQAMGPIQNPVEMGHSLVGAVKKLKNDAEYNKTFTKLYPDGVTSKNLVNAIAEFEKALIKMPFPKQQKEGMDFLNPKDVFFVIMASISVEIFTINSAYIKTVNLPSWEDTISPKKKRTSMSLKSLL